MPDIKKLFELSNPDKKWYDVQNINDEYIINITGIIGGVSKNDEDENDYYTPYNQTKEWWDNELAWLMQIETKKITLNVINSLGGSALYALAMYDVLRTKNAEVSTYLMGYGASAATILLECGRKGKRNISKNAFFLVHEPFIDVENLSDQQKSLIDKVKQRIATVYSETTGKSIDECLNIMALNEGKGEWMTADQTIELGFMDNIIKEQRVAADASELIPAFGLPTPKILNQNKLNMEILTDIKNQLAELKNKIFGTEKTEPEKVDHSEKLTAIENKIAEVEQVNTELSETNNTLTSEIEGLNNKVTEKETEIESLKNKITELEKSAGKETKPAPMGSDPLNSGSKETDPEMLKSISALKNKAKITKEGDFVDVKE